MARRRADPARGPLQRAGQCIGCCPIGSFVKLEIIGKLPPSSRAASPTNERSAYSISADFQIVPARRVVKRAQPDLPMRESAIGGRHPVRRDRLPSSPSFSKTRRAGRPCLPTLFRFRCDLDETSERADRIDWDGSIRSSRDSRDRGSSCIRRRSGAVTDQGGGSMLWKSVPGFAAVCVAAIGATGVFAGPPRHDVAPTSHVVRNGAVAYHGSVPHGGFVPHPEIHGYPDGVWHGDGCGCDACHGVPAWGPCCHPHLIPRVLRGVGILVHELFTCHRCYDPCCAGDCGWDGCGGCGVGFPACGCGGHGCDDCGGGVPVDMPGDVLVPSAESVSRSARPMMPRGGATARTPYGAPNRSYATRPRAVPAQSTGHASAPTPHAEKRAAESGHSATKKAKGVASRVPARTASAARPRPIEAPADRDDTPVSDVRRANHLESTGSVPHNPLRAR